MLVDRRLTVALAFVATVAASAPLLADPPATGTPNVSAETHRGDVWKARALRATADKAIQKRRADILSGQIGFLLNEARVPRAQTSIRLAAVAYATRSWPYERLRKAVTYVTDCEAGTTLGGMTMVPTRRRW